MLASLFVVLHAQTTVNHTLIMRNVSTDTMWDGRIVPIYGFAPNILNAWLPGPTLEANEGDTLNVWVWNISQGAPHTVHWHGMDVDQANDGVAHTSFSLGHMQDTNYIFPAQNAGTYFYHCHVHSVKHVQMGMYGPIVILPADGSKRAWTGGPSYHQEKLWMVSELDSYWHDSLVEEPVMHPDSLHDEVEVPVYAPDYFLINGLSESQLDSPLTEISARESERVYLRLINVGYCQHRYTFPAMLNATVLDSDGRPLPDSVRTDTLEIFPGERYGVILTASARLDTTIQIEFADPFTGASKSIQWVPVYVRGHVGIEEPAGDEQLTLAPNPAGDKVLVSWKTEAESQSRLILTDLVGKVMQEIPVQGGTRKCMVDISSLPDGVYLVQMGSPAVHSAKRLVVLH